MTKLKWKIVSVDLEIVLILTQDGCTLCVERTIGSENHFERTRSNFYVMQAMWIIVLVYLEMELASVQDRCMV
jgi:hypothetical protein